MCTGKLEARQGGQHPFSFLDLIFLLPEVSHSTRSFLVYPVILSVPCSTLFYKYPSNLGLGSDWAAVALEELLDGLAVADGGRLGVVVGLRDLSHSGNIFLNRIVLHRW